MPSGLSISCTKLEQTWTLIKASIVGRFAAFLGKLILSQHRCGPGLPKIASPYSLSRGTCSILLHTVKSCIVHRRQLSPGTWHFFTSSTLPSIQTRREAAKLCFSKSQDCTCLSTLTGCRLHDPRQTERNYKSVISQLEK